MSDPIDFQFVEATEKFLRLVALLVVSLGVKNINDYYAAVGAQLVYWALGYKGPQAMYSMLAGIQFGRGRYMYSMFPTLLDTYYTINDFSTGKVISYKTIAVDVLWVLGFFLGKKRYI